MEPAEGVLTFWPSYGQFVLYDVQAPPYNLEEDLFWSKPDEAKGQASVRRTEMAIALIEDMDVNLYLSVHDKQPESLTGDWQLKVEASLLVASGELGVRDVMNDAPDLSVQVPAGQVRLRVYGHATDDEQVFYVQVWPEQHGS